MTVTEVYEDVAEILAQLSPEKVVGLKASEKMAERVEWLISKQKEESLSSDESIELERYLSLDLLINLAKARAKKLLTS